jgi:hypothetical protein
MKKKLVGICIIIIIFTITIPASVTNMIDLLDQQSIKDDGSRLVTLYHLGQSFIPNFPKLTKVMLLMTKSSSDAMYESYNVEIRTDSLTSQTITQCNLDRSYINPGRNWVEFDFPDIDVTVGNTYYIILHGETMTGDIGSVSWHYGYPNPYVNGSAYRNTPGGWFDLNETVEMDFCFKTFGIPENHPPGKPDTPNGQTSGKSGVVYLYSSKAVDQDGHQVQLLFDWGDGTDSGWLPPVNSGQIVTASNSWSTEGNYQIKVRARDIPSSTVGPWSDPLPVAMPKTKELTIIQLWWQRFIEQFPFMEFIFPESLVLQ